MPVDVTTGGPSTWKAETTPPSRALDEVLDCGRAQLIPAVAKSGLAASRPYSAIYLDFFRLNVVPACSASLVLGVRPRLEMNSLFWIPPCHSDTWLTRHLLQPPSPAFETLLTSSRSRTLPLLCRSLSQAGPNRYHLSILLLLRWPIHDHCIRDFHNCPAARAGCALVTNPTSVTPFLLGLNLELSMA